MLNGREFPHPLVKFISGNAVSLFAPRTERNDVCGLVRLFDWVVPNPLLPVPVDTLYQPRDFALAFRGSTIPPQGALRSARRSSGFCPARSEPADLGGCKQD
jgi:hypothetical protein